MRVATNGRVRRTADEWRTIVQRFQDSGLSSRAFCRQEQVNLSSLMRWQRKLVAAGAESSFVELTAPEQTTPAWSVEVELPDGCIVRLRG